MRRVISVLAGAALVLAAGFASAEVSPPPPQQQGCDFMTGGGWIIHNGAKGTFGVGGGCKHGSGVTTPEYWGHRLLNAGRRDLSAQPRRGRRRGRQHPAPQAQPFDHGGLRWFVPRVVASTQRLEGEWCSITDLRSWRLAGAPRLFVANAPGATVTSAWRR